MGPGKYPVFSIHPQGQAANHIHANLPLCQTVQSFSCFQNFWSAYRLVRALPPPEPCALLFERASARGWARAAAARDGAAGGLLLLSRLELHLPRVLPALLRLQPRAARALHGRGLPPAAGAALLRGPLLPVAVGSHDYYVARPVPGVSWSGQTCQLDPGMV